MLKPALESCRKRGSMSPIARNENEMPDVPEPDFVDALCEIWFGLSYAAYHLTYVRVYSQTAALQRDVNQLRSLEQVLRDMTQVDLIICRTHLASFFWHLDHIFEALRTAITRGQKDHPALKYFWSWEKRLEEIEREAIRQEISAYRNEAHWIPAIIGCAWEKEGGKFLHHFLPTIHGHEQKETIDMNAQLQLYFEYVANVWLYFVPGDFKGRFPHSFSFPVTVPNSYLGELPPELRRVPQLEVSMEAFNLKDRSSKRE
jgi:hypothetical protein